MKKFILAGIIAVIVVAGGTVYLASQYLKDPKAAASPGSATCQGTRKTHLVLIKNDTMIPEHIQAALCDKLTIINKDPTLRLVAFGSHAHHTPYDGVIEDPLEQGQHLTITLNQPGTYQFHEHLEDIAHGTFTVTK